MKTFTLDLPFEKHRIHFHYLQSPCCAMECHRLALLTVPLYFWWFILLRNEFTVLWGPWVPSESSFTLLLLESELHYSPTPENGLDQITEFNEYHVAKVTMCFSTVSHKRLCDFLFPLCLGQVSLREGRCPGLRRLRNSYREVQEAGTQGLLLTSMT